MARIHQRGRKHTQRLSDVTKRTRVVKSKWKNQKNYDLEDGRKPNIDSNIHDKADGSSTSRHLRFVLAEAVHSNVHYNAHGSSVQPFNGCIPLVDSRPQGSME